MLNFLARFCPNLSVVVKALRELTHKDIPFQWNDSHEKAFVESKKLIALFCVSLILSCLQPFKWMCLVLALVDASCKMISLRHLIHLTEKSDPKLIFPALEYDKFLKPSRVIIVVRNHA